MKNLLILGGGTAGTMMLNKLIDHPEFKDWHFTIVDKDENHYYQPGFLFIPFGIYTKEEVVWPKREFFPKKAEVIFDEVTEMKPEENKVLLKSGKELAYDLMIIATGTEPVPEETAGLKDKLWYKDIFDFYSYEGSCKLADKLADWPGGRLVINIAEMPIKCPVAPLEFAFLADDFFKKKGMRDKVEIIYTTPLSGAFTKPKATAMLSELLDKKTIEVVPDFYIESVDNEAKTINSYDGTSIPFDLLVSIPTNKGTEAVERSGMGDSDDLNFIPTDKQTLQSAAHKNIFVIGDATNLPTSKAGSVAHFEGDILTENLLHFIKNEPLAAKFDGHANCFIETGEGKAILLDFNYVTEPLPGKFPIPVFGPMSLLEESRMNHWGKLMFKPIYKNILLRGKELPVSSEMTMAGKLTD